MVRPFCTFVVRSLMVFFWAVGLLTSLTDASEPPVFSREQLDHFEKHVRPVLAEHCYACHSGQSKKIKAGLRLDNRAGLLAGGDTGPAIEPGNADESLLIQAVKYDAFEMPPKGMLSADAIGKLAKWINDGAAWPPGEDVGQPAGHGGGGGETFDWKERKAQHWSWRPIVAVAPPEGEAEQPVDAFLSERLNEIGLPVAAPADRRTLLRRVYFDLIGLPPTREQIAEFLADDSDTAYEQVVDSLLASPHFGEKWARHWLDLVRYAESYGHEFDYSIPHAWRYRDYVIDALNDDVGYDQFLREHFAGDLLRSPRLDPKTKRNVSIIGTGFWFLGEATHAPTDVLEDQAARIENQIDVACRTFMGLSVSCARCHDHKFDPISTADYYALSGVMQSSRRHIASVYPAGAVEAAMEQLQAADATAKTILDHSVAHLDGADLAGRLLGSLKKGGDEKLAAVVRSDEATRLTHPLWIWNRLAEMQSRSSDEKGSREKGANGQGENGKINRLRSKLVKAERLSRSACEQWEVISAADSAQPWFISGSAFERSRIGAFRLSDDGPRVVAEAGFVGGRLSQRLPGVLRSPSFTLSEEGEVRVRLRGKDVQVALVIHGYYMTGFNGLLFHRTMLEPKDLGGAVESDGGSPLRWHTLGNALQKNREAHLEVRFDANDGENGFAEVCEIRVPKGDSVTKRKQPVPPSPHGWATGIANDDSVVSVEQLSRAYGKCWDACRERWAAGEPTAEDAQFVDVLLRNGQLAVAEDLAPVKEMFVAATEKLPQPMRILAIAEGTPFNSPIAIRGKAASQGEIVSRRLPTAMGEDQPPVTGSGRLELANRLLDEKNPFAARVEVNRLWHHLFGRGLVPTVCDFGAMGQPPSHPKLLDWLAADFREHGWSRKRMIRQLVTSRTYRMSSVPADKELSKELDPDNQWLHRMSVRRLPAEAIRDQLLYVSKRLKTEVGGDSVPVYLTPFMQGRGRPKENGARDSEGRRSLYIAIRRNFLPTDLLAFDFPKPLTSIGTRTRSNVPAQSLFMMNNPLVREHAELLAKQLLDDFVDPSERLLALFETVIGTSPTAVQIADCEAFLADASEANKGDEQSLQSWSDLCHVVLNMKDFIFLR